MSYRMSRLFWPLLCILTLAACGGPHYTTKVLETPQNKELKSYEKPYTVNGKRYDPLRSHVGFVQSGMASWYGPDFNGKKTSNGEIYDMNAMTAAHKTLPLGVYVRVTNTANGKQATVRINDRGPFVKNRVIDLSYSAAKQLGVVGPGTAPVRIEALGYRQGDQGGKVSYRPANYDAGSFTVQVGAFAMAANAKRLASEMTSRYGYATVSKGLVNSQLFYRVWVGRYESLKAAETAKVHFAKGGFASSFVVAFE